MRKIMLTTALATILAAGPLMAQESGMPADFAPPEGFSQAGFETLTFEDLRGATLYDAAGETVGEVSDFVLQTTGALNGTGTADGAMTGEAATADANVAAEGTVAEETAEAVNEGAEAVAEGAEAMAEGAENAAEAVVDGTVADGTATDATTDMANAPAMDFATATGSITGMASHVILDIGGFLGIGQHTVAVPIDALQIFRGESASDVRVYLPWTQEQLEALPEYVAGDYSTLGTSTGAVN